MSTAVAILTPALEAAIAAWDEWKKGKSILAQYPPGAEVLEPLAEAIENTAEYKRVAGIPVFSGYSGVVLTGSALADQLLYRADAQYRLGIAGAIDWLNRVLTTTHADGTYEVAIWGIKPDNDIEIAKGWLLRPFISAPDSPIKRKLKDFIRPSWDGSVWHSTRFYDAPGAILTHAVKDIPYLGRPDLSYEALHSLDQETKDRLAFLQACLIGTSVIGSSWFSYDDHELDFNSIENRLQWLVPEVEPIVRSNTEVEATNLANAIAALAKLPTHYGKKVVRSADRFALSQCRHRRIDVAIDLAIAFELLIGSKGDGPISWKVSLRTAQLIGGNLDRRLHLRETVNALYKYRNEGSHGGTASQAEIAEQSAVLSESGAIYRDLLENILFIGAEPDWRQLELEARTHE